MITLLGYYWPPLSLVETALGGAAVGDAVVEGGCLSLGCHGSLGLLGSMRIMSLENLIAIVFLVGAFLVNIRHTQASLLVHRNQMHRTLLGLVIIIQHAVDFLLEELKSPLGLIPIGHFFTLLMQSEDPHVEIVHGLLEG